ncbi:trypsin-like peptidase domain-containing protein [Rubripirellula reticaptiva]|uniref:Uncharacterized protein n=1 Tax=Rubripirellula reticaptiva TaxID=2528013 RepID=A0A5C6EKW5_9BACT|nr:trypsin-like peptidase domain-containing protein [Rubripirellula reticaptiva]TWU49468.1 hypothetical protein Poly59_40830 [Rubripirellula reticaptiva]
MSSVPYPKSCVWYVEARSGKDSDAVRSVGSAVCVRLKRASDEQPRKYLLTCSHVVRAKSADGRPAAGALLPFILCWAPGRGFVPIKDSSDWPSEADCGVWTAKVVDVFNRATDGVAADDLEESRDWVLLDVEQADFQDYPSVMSWAEPDDAGISIVGFPAGAALWKPSMIVESLSADSFRREVSASSPALTLLTSPEETAPGMSGGGLFNQDGGFSGLHRAQSVAARQTSGIRAKHIEQELGGRGYTAISAQPSAVQRDEDPVVEARPTAEFFQFVQDAGSMYAKVAYGVVLLPIVAYFAGVASPFPNETFMGIAASIAAFFSLMFAFQLWLHGETTKKRRDKLLVRNGVAALICVVLYTGLFSMFVVIDDRQGSKEVVGFRYQPDIEIVRGSQSPPLTDRQLLENFEGEPERIWTKFSLAITRMGMLAGWMLMWFLLTITIGVFLCDSWLRQRKTN